MKRLLTSVAVVLAIGGGGVALAQVGGRAALVGRLEQALGGASEPSAATDRLGALWAADRLGRTWRTAALEGAHGQREQRLAVVVAGLRSRSLAEAELLLELITVPAQPLGDLAAEALVHLCRRIDHLSLDQAPDADEDGPGALRALAARIFEAVQNPSLPASRRPALLEAHDELAATAGTPSLLARRAQLRYGK
jgi:hypothetical protein